MPPTAGRTSRGFTLIELLIAVTLLVLILLAISFIFDTTLRAMGIAQANNELNVKLEAFSGVLRRDVGAIEHQGFLVLGGRNNPNCYGSRRDKANQFAQTFRNDWMSFYRNGEQDGALDSRMVGQWAKVFYGHGRASDPAGYAFVDQTSSMPLRAGADLRFSNLATDWVLLRQQFIMLSKVLVTSPTYEGVEVAGETYQYGTGPMYGRSLLSYNYRDFRWSSWYNSQWLGSVQVDYGVNGGTGTGRLAIFEPTYYNFMPLYSTADWRGVRALAQCAVFRVQYAMPADLTAGPAGGVKWNDPPVFVDSGSPGKDDGRLAFKPGDRWPALLKVSVHLFDPLDRVEGGRMASFVLAVP
jgi:prepilin-type N-terminal cleavage/methylation domain-containing protein